VELASEPLYIVASTQLLFKRQGALETAGTLARALGSLGLLAAGLHPFLAFSWAQLGYAGVLLLGYCVLGRATLAQVRKRGAGASRRLQQLHGGWALPCGALRAAARRRAVTGRLTAPAPAPAPQAAPAAARHRWDAHDWEVLRLVGQFSLQSVGRWRPRSLDGGLLGLSLRWPLHPSRWLSPSTAHRRAPCTHAKPLAGPSQPPAAHRPSPPPPPSPSHLLLQAEKLVLAEGSKVVLVAVESSRAAGVYALVSNLGSLLVRTLLQPLEDVAFTAFSRCGGQGQAGAGLAVGLSSGRLPVRGMGAQARAWEESQPGGAGGGGAPCRLAAKRAGAQRASLCCPAVALGGMRCPAPPLVTRTAGTGAGRAWRHGMRA
jgi:oligosaccharide translocation protein RFT1